MTLADRLLEAKQTMPTSDAPGTDPLRKNLLLWTAKTVLEIVETEGGLMPRHEAFHWRRQIVGADGKPLPDNYLTGNRLLKAAKKERRLELQLLKRAFRAAYGGDITLRPDNAELCGVYCIPKQPAILAAYLKNLVEGRPNQSGRALIITLQSPYFETLISDQANPGGRTRHGYRQHIE